MQRLLNNIITLSMGGNQAMAKDEMRSLVEVSDVYCSRDLHNLYCELWYTY